MHPWQKGGLKKNMALGARLQKLKGAEFSEKQKGAKFLEGV